jgi:hypothetical protein
MSARRCGVAFKAIQPGPGGEKERGDLARMMMGPTGVDQQIRHSIQMIWMMLPEDRRTADEVEREFRRLMDRALRDFREDAQAFGIGG